MEIKLELPENLVKAISTLSKAWNLPFEKTIEFVLIGNMARKAAFGDVFQTPEPGIEFVRTPEGKMLEGDELYKDIYMQVRAWINNLLLAEKLVMELANKEQTTTELQDPKLNTALQFYRDKKEYAN